MCFPGAPIAIAAAQAMATIAQQQQTYANQETAYKQNYANALSDNRDAEDSLQRQEMEQNASYAQKDNLTLIEGAEKAATARTAAATGGVAGNSVDAIVNGVNEQIALKRGTLQTNWQSQVQQTESEKVTSVAQESSRIGEVANPVDPSPLGTLIGVAGAGASYGATPSGQNFFSSLGSSGAASSASSGGSGGGAGLNTMTTNGFSLAGA